MTNLYQIIKRLSKDKIIEIGRFYSVDKEGFEKYVNENWEKDSLNKNGEYVKALVAIVVLLHERPVGCEHEISTLHNMFNDTKNEKNLILNPLSLFFQEKESINGKFDIVKEYKDKLEIKDQIGKIIEDLKLMSLTPFTPVINDKMVERLKQLNNQYAYVTTFSNGKIKAQKGPKKIYVKGNNAKNLIIQFGNVNFRFIGTTRGVYSISNQDNQLVYKNNISFNADLSTVEKIAYLYGIEEARKYAERKIYEITTEKDDNYKKSKATEKVFEDFLK